MRDGVVASAPIIIVWELAFVYMLGESRGSQLGLAYGVWVQLPMLLLGAPWTFIVWSHSNNGFIMSLSSVLAITLNFSLLIGLRAISPKVAVSVSALISLAIAYCFFVLR